MPIIQIFETKMVLLLCLWDNLKFWRIFSLGSRENLDQDSGGGGLGLGGVLGGNSGNNGSGTGSFCGGGGVMSVVPSSCIPTSVSASTAKVSCSYYVPCKPSEARKEVKRQQQDNRLSSDGDDDDDEEDDGGLKFTTEVRHFCLLKNLLY